MRKVHLIKDSVSGWYWSGKQSMFNKDIRLAKQFLTIDNAESVIFNHPFFDNARKNMIVSIEDHYVSI